MEFCELILKKTQKAVPVFFFAMDIYLCKRMKKAIAAISLFFYVTATCGLVINSHYCMKRLVSVEINFMERQAEECSLCGMDLHGSDNGCCHNESLVVKLVQDQVNGPVAQFDLNPAKFINSPSTSVLQLLMQEIEFVSGSYFYPPPLSGPPDLYLQNRVFRI